MESLWYFHRELYSLLESVEIIHQLASITTAKTMETWIFWFLLECSITFTLEMGQRIDCFKKCSLSSMEMHQTESINELYWHQGQDYFAVKCCEMEMIAAVVIAATREAQMEGISQEGRNCQIDIADSPLGMKYARFYNI